MTLDKILRQQAQPAIQCGPIFPVEYIQQLLLHDPGGQFEIVGAQSVVQGFISQTPFRKPGGRPAVQLRHLLGSDTRPAGAAAAHPGTTGDSDTTRGLAGG